MSGMERTEAPKESQNNACKSGWWGDDPQYQYMQLRESSSYGIPNQTPADVHESPGEQPPIQAKVRWRSWLWLIGLRGCIEIRWAGKAAEGWKPYNEEAKCYL